jgi:glycosyltransferase involved in cell wall biosynthesis
VKIAYLTAGAAGMLCGSCLHDNTLAAAMLEEGEDVLLVPTYTPVRTDEPDVSQERIFYGGIQVFLQQKWSFFRRPPQWFDRWLGHWLDHPALLGKLAGRASSVDPTQLGELTVSMLRGESGHQHKELGKLATWLRDEVQPEVIHLSNSMMLGMARTLGNQCGCPLVCTLSGEDLFLDKLLPPYRAEAIGLIRQQAGAIDAWVTMNGYYADYMTDYLTLDRRRVQTIPHGLRLDEYGPRHDKPDGGPARIGYLARICPDKGLHLLIDACLRLADRNDLPPWELQAAGYLGPGDRAYLEQLETKIATGPLADKWTYRGELDYPRKMAFLQSVDLFSVPTVYPESKGLSVLEALAAGVPVVVPAHGTFPELLADTEGGLLCQPLDPADLAAKLAELLLDPVRAVQLGRLGLQAIHARYHAPAMARATVALYRKLVRS